MSAALMILLILFIMIEILRGYRLPASQFDRHTDLQHAFRQEGHQNYAQES